MSMFIVTCYHHTSTRTPHERHFVHRRSAQNWVSVPTGSYRALSYSVVGVVGNTQFQALLCRARRQQPKCNMECRGVGRQKLLCPALVSQKQKRNNSHGAVAHWNLLNEPVATHHRFQSLCMKCKTNPIFWAVATHSWWFLVYVPPDSNHSYVFHTWNFSWP